MTTTTPPRASRAKKPAEAALEKDTKTGDLLAAAGAAPPFEVVPVAPQAPAVPMKSPAERAVLALNSTERETELKALALKSADIVEVKNKDGREQVHRMAMTLKNTRVEIEKVGKAARDDANQFCTAELAEERRLIAIIKAEEDRVFKLRDDFDAEQARIAKEEKERNEARIAAIRAKIDAITALPREHAGADSTALKAVLLDLAAREVTEEEFAELAGEAELALKTTADALIALHTGALEREQAEAERVRLAEEERQRIEAEKEANRLAAARLAEQQAQAERARKEVEQAAAALKLAQEQQKRTVDAANFFNDFAATPGDARVLDEILEDARRSEVDGAETFGPGAGMVKMARDMAIKTLESRLAQAVAEELPAAHAEALELNAQFDALHAKPLPGGQHYSKTTFRDDGKPILLNADGSRSVFCDLDEGCDGVPEPAPAPAAEPAPEPAPLPLPEAYSPVDELIDMGTLTDAADEGERKYRIITGEDVVKAVAKHFGLDWYGAVSVLRNLDFNALASVGELTDA